MSQEKDVVKVFGVPFPVQQKTGLLDAFKKDNNSEQKLTAKDLGIPPHEYDFASQVRDVLASIPDFINPEGMVIDAIERTIDNRGYSVKQEIQEIVFTPARVDPRTQAGFLNTKDSMGEFVIEQVGSEKMLTNPNHGTGKELITEKNEIILTPSMVNHSQVTMRRLYRMGSNNTPQVSDQSFDTIEQSKESPFMLATDTTDVQNNPVQTQSQIEYSNEPSNADTLPENVVQFPIQTSPFLSNGPIQIVRSDLDGKKAA
jgi:hypothetical protein